MKIVSLINILNHLINHPLNKSNKIAAISRFLRWQIGSRLVPGEIICKWINGSRIIASTGEMGVTGNIYCGLHEFSDMAFLLHVLREEDLFIDVGANVGSYTILASSAVRARTVCFEPVPSTYDRLVSNIRVNDLEKKVASLNVALGNSKGEIHFSSDQNCSNHVLSDNETLENKIIVNVSTLDEELSDVPFLIKIDVEGYETPALEGAENTLRNEELCCVIMELNGSGERYGYNELNILNLMHDYGFKTYSYKPFERKLVNLEGKNLVGGNTIFIRNVDCILERIKKAQKIEVHGFTI